MSASMAKSAGKAAVAAVNVKASKTSGVPINLTWEPFLLNPKMDAEGESLVEHITGKYGAKGVQMINDPNAYLYRAGRDVGIQFTKDRNIYPTQKAHALMEYLKEEHGNDMANKVMEEMYRRYFEKGENINSVEKLTEIAGMFGISQEQAQAAMEDWHNIQAVEEKDTNYKRRMGISGVPFFILERADGQRPVGFSGAQPIDIIAEQLEEAAGI